LFLFVDAFLVFLLLTAAGAVGNNACGSSGVDALWKACMVISIGTSRWLLVLELVLVSLGLEVGFGRRGQMRRLKVVCQTRKTIARSSRRTGSEREQRSKDSGLRVAAIIVGDEGVTMEFLACCTLASAAAMWT
jgi:hypothetical protein